MCLADREPVINYLAVDQMLSCKLDLIIVIVMGMMTRVTRITVITRTTRMTMIANMSLTTVIKPKDEV